MSTHNYRYATGMNSLIIQMLRWTQWHGYGAGNVGSYEWTNAPAYNYGIGEPHYPVPALRWNKDYGGVLGDFIYTGAWFVDWSRGSIEVY